MGLKNIKVKPLVFDSYGVRSMATFVETDIKITVDPGAALGPKRYGLPPSPPELEALDSGLSKIKRYVKRSEYITISHYHYDHYIHDENVYRGKTLFIKDPKNNINRSQKVRGEKFLDLVDDTVKINISDDHEFELGRTTLEFSPPVPHGDERSRLGYVIMCSVEYHGEVIVHASDVQGPQTKIATDWIIKRNPYLLILSGFPTLFLGWKASRNNLEKSNQNLIRILKETDVETIILDHHIVRDLNYQTKILPVLSEADRLGKRVITAAEYNGDEPLFLEGMRKAIWDEIKG